MSAYNIVKTLVRTEKGTVQETQRKYIFEVSYESNKIQIRKAVEEIYKVKVQDVNTSIQSGKAKRVRQELGRTPSWKKAIVTLKPENKIEVS
jgi:large subunit ribosomal protein L23